MKPNQPSAQRSNERGSVPRRDDVPDRTPNPDMQPEDAGTAESGNAARGSDESGKPAEPAMKQTSKTAQEGDS